ncbi:MAG: adenosine deaminase [Chloroflexota bacterium]|nr:adenosine deaminase [Ardenticatenaceae bacterium]
MTNLTQFIQDMPKAEVHIHLEGAIQPETVLKLAKHHHQLDKLPGDTVDALRNWFTFTDFPHFVKIYVAIQDLLRTAADFALIAYECGADMARQNIRYRELTVTPYTHTDHQDKGLTIDDILQGLEEGRQRAKEEFGVEMRWVFDVPRNLSFGDNGYSPYAATRTLEFALAGRDKGVVGFGLGGWEPGAPPRHFAHAFAAAKEAGLLCVPHAGETLGADSVWGAVNELQADRIGHGVRAIEDPELLALLKERQIPLEINPTSNICLGVYRRLAEHPFPHLDRMGLLVTVNSDDPPLFNTDLSGEYAVLATEFGYDAANLARVARNAFAVAGLEAETKQRLLSEFDAWAKQTVAAST